MTHNRADAEADADPDQTTVRISDIAALSCIDFGEFAATLGLANMALVATTARSPNILPVTTIYSQKK
jgi:hypothetical protein